jgi:hypothetical protein
MYQALGMVGMVKSISNGYRWLKNLYKGPIEKKTEVPQKKLPMVPVLPAGSTA